MFKLSILVVLAGCYQHYYVADIHTSGDGLVMTKCAVANHWYCHDEAIEDTDGYAGGTPDPAEIRHVERELAAARPAPRPVPTDMMIAQALAAPGVHRLVEQCRNTYAKDVTSFDVGLVIAPSGAITGAAREATNDRFADCATRAVATANIAPFDGAPVQSEQRLAL